MGPDGKVSWYDNHTDATAWLTKRGFVPRDQVLRERLIPEGSVTPVLHSRVSRVKFFASASFRS